MPLRAWYPLNGNANNMGASNLTLTQTTAPTWTTGKTAAQSLNTGAYQWTAAQTATILNNNAFSYAAWIYVGDSDTRSMIFGTDTTPRRFCLFQYPTKNDFHYSWNQTDSGSVFSGIVTGALPTGKWTHVAAVYQKGHAWFYINGVLKASGTPSCSITSYSAVTNVIHNNSNHRLQDVRVYDHALSQKEVAELAKGMMLHIPMYAGYTGVGTNLCAGWKDMQTFSLGSSYKHILGDSNFFGLQVGDTYTYQVKVTAPETKGIKARVQYYTNSSTRTGPTSSITVAAGTTGYTYLTDTITEAKRGYDSMQLDITNATTSVTDTTSVLVGEVKLELGTVPTPWSSSTDADYAIKDCSGYQNAVGTVGSIPTVSGDAPRYGVSARINGSTGCIWPIPDPINSSTQEFTISVWFKTTTTSGNQCIWNGRTTTGAAVAIFLIGSGIRVDDSNQTTSVSVSTNTWYHLAVTWKSGGNKVIYLNGEQKTSVAAGTLSKSNANASIGRSSSGDYLSTSNYFSGQMSDFRIYATALTADQVKELYNAPISVANTGACLSGQFTEGATGIAFAKTGVVSCNGISSLPGKYDPEVLIEPDGSCWAHIGHHADPTTYKFASSDPFATGVWKDDRRFLDPSFCDNVDKWEFIVEQKQTSSSNVERFRWAQQVNPNTGTFENTVASNITRYGTSYGYNNSGYGGMYKLNSSTYYCCNNGTKGNWMGAIGAWTAHNGGIPGYGGTIKDGGYTDLYIRIDNVTFTNGRTGCSLDKAGKAVLSPEFMEQ